MLRRMKTEPRPSLAVILVDHGRQRRSGKWSVADVGDKLVPGTVGVDRGQLLGVGWVLCEVRAVHDQGRVHLDSRFVEPIDDIENALRLVVFKRPDLWHALQVDGFAVVLVIRHARRMSVRITALNRIPPKPGPARREVVPGG